MGWFKRDRKDGEDADHEKPVEIDLGMQKSFEVEMEIERLNSIGLWAYLFAQREAPEFGGIGPMHCRVYVKADDEPRIRAELASAGFL